MGLRKGLIKGVIKGLILVLAFGCGNSVKMSDSPSKVAVKKEGEKYVLYVNNEPYIVKGAGLEFGDIESLANSGANTFRTWTTENGQKDGLEILDLAQENGLMVLMCLEVTQERHGFDYNDSVKVKKQFDYLKGEVERLKDHPAILGWAIGNELNFGVENLEIYDAVNDISLMIHEIDPNHITTTTTSSVPSEVIDYIEKNCTDLDFLSFQLYGSIVHLQRMITESGWEGPYMVTEWGATGHWEVALTKWGAPIEQTSQEKSKSLIKYYNTSIEPYTDKCIGSYVFVWEQKQERTPTWYGLFLEGGEKTEMVDAMQYIWTGEWPENRAPSIDSLHLGNKSAFDNVTISLSEKIIAEVFVKNYEDDSLTYRWEIIPESINLSWGGASRRETRDRSTHRG